MDGEYTNYILANGNNGIGFYAVKDGSTLVAGKAYLQLPTASLSAAAKERGISFVFEDGNAPTNIEAIGLSHTEKGAYYNLNGQRIEHPTKGLYIKDGKKIFIQ